MTTTTTSTVSLPPGDAARRKRRKAPDDAGDEAASAPRPSKRARVLLQKTHRLKHVSPYLQSANLVLRVLDKFSEGWKNVVIAVDADGTIDELWADSLEAHDVFSSLDPDSVYYFQGLAARQRPTRLRDSAPVYKLFIVDTTLVSEKLEPSIVPAPPSLDITMDSLTQMSPGSRVNFTGTVVIVEAPVHSRDPFHRVVVLADEGLNVVMVQVPQALWSDVMFALLTTVTLTDCHISHTHKGTMLVCDRHTRFSNRGPLTDKWLRPQYTKLSRFQWQSEWRVSGDADFYNSVEQLNKNRDIAYLGIDHATLLYDPDTSLPYYLGCSRCRRGVTGRGLEACHCRGASSQWMYRFNVMILEDEKKHSPRAVDAVIFNRLALTLMKNQPADKLHAEIDREIRTDPLLPKYRKKITSLINLTNVSLKVTYKRGCIVIDEITPSSRGAPSDTVPIDVDDPPRSEEEEETADKLSSDDISRFCSGLLAHEAPGKRTGISGPVEMIDDDEDEGPQGQGNSLNPTHSSGEKS